MIPPTFERGVGLCRNCRCGGWNTTSVCRKVDIRVEQNGRGPVPMLLGTDYGADYLPSIIVMKITENSSVCNRCGLFGSSARFG